MGSRAAVPLLVGGRGSLPVSSIVMAGTEAVLGSETMLQLLVT